MAWRRHRQPGSPAAAPAAPAILPREALALLDGLTDEWAVLDRTGVVRSSLGFQRLGVVSAGAIGPRELAGMDEHTRADGKPRLLELAIGGIDVGAPPRRVRVRASRLDGDRVLIVVEDISAATRVDAMRRDFIATVAGEMRTPVDAMLANAADMQRALRKGRPLEDLAGAVEARARQLGALVTDITHLSRLQSADAMDAAHTLDVRDAVTSAVEDVQALAQAKRMHIEVEVPGVHLFANEDQLATALNNLLTNAIAYSDPHTKVTVTARDVGHTVEIAVADEGHGIPEEHRARIFERFHRIDKEQSRERGGTGLGLAIVQHICMAHGGEVTVDSEVGRGSVFTLRFPTRTRVAPIALEALQEDS